MATQSASNVPMLRLTGGKLIDPANGIDGEVRDIYLADGKIVEALPEGATARTIDATGMIVMPGGVEMHSHIASAAVNATRAIQSTAGYEVVVPSAPETGRLYAMMGYTTAIEPAVAPGAAAVSHMQLDRLPNLDAGILVLMGNHEGIIERLAQGDENGAVALVQHLLASTGAYGIKAVNPAAVAAWRRDPSRHHVDAIDDAVPGLPGISPVRMLDLFTQAQEMLGLAHPTHIHGPQLGEPGNIEITLAMLRALAGRRCHLAHLQYYCYGKAKAGGFQSAAERLVAYLADHPEVTADLGLVAFGPAFTATADLPLEHGLYRHVGVPTKPAFFLESGNEDCFGVMPLIHAEHNPTHAIQWATGLELALLWEDPWRYALTVDHPNGGSFLNYPSLIAMLMSKARRDEQLARCHKQARHRTGLGAIEREMTLTEVAIITRAAPAKALGLTDKGHLGVGADADVTIYQDRPDDPEMMFAQPHYVIKGCQVVVDQGCYMGDAPSRRLHAPVEPTDHGRDLWRQWARRVGAVMA